MLYYRGARGQMERPPGQGGRAPSSSTHASSTNTSSGSTSNGNSSSCNRSCVNSGMTRELRSGAAHSLGASRGAGTSVTIAFGRSFTATVASSTSPMSSRSRSNKLLGRSPRQHIATVHAVQMHIVPPRPDVRKQHTQQQQQQQMLQQAKRLRNVSGVRMMGSTAAAGSSSRSSSNSGTVLRTTAAATTAALTAAINAGAQQSKEADSGARTSGESHEADDALVVVAGDAAAASATAAAAAGADSNGNSSGSSSTIEDKRKPNVDAAAAAAAVADSVTVEGSNVQSIASAAAADSDTAVNSSCSSSSTVCSAGVTAKPALHAGDITFLVGGKEEEHPAQSAADKAAQTLLRIKAAEFLAALEQPGIDGDHPDALAAYSNLVYNRTQINKMTVTELREGIRYCLLHALLLHAVTYRYHTLLHRELPSQPPDNATSGLKAALRLRLTRTVLRVMAHGAPDAATARSLLMDIPENPEHPMVQLLFDPVLTTAAAAAAGGSSSGSGAVRTSRANAAAAGSGGGSSSTAARPSRKTGTRASSRT
eukprot:15551-Heterococcus_DN1.PRE.1